MYSDQLLCVNMYLKSKLKHCCYLTVTVKLLCLVIYWWPGKQATHFIGKVEVKGGIKGSGARGRGDGEVKGHGFFPEILSDDIFCTETQQQLLFCTFL